MQVVSSYVSELTLRLQREDERAQRWRRGTAQEATAIIQATMMVASIRARERTHSKQISESPGLSDLWNVRGGRERPEWRTTARVRSGASEWFREGALGRGRRWLGDGDVFIRSRLYGVPGAMASRKLDTWNVLYQKRP